MMAMVIGDLGTFPKGLEKRLKELEIRGRIEALRQLRSARLLRKVLSTCGYLVSFRLS